MDFWKIEGNMMVAIAMMTGSHASHISSEWRQSRNCETWMSKGTTLLLQFKGGTGSSKCLSDFEGLRCSFLHLLRVLCKISVDVF